MAERFTLYAAEPIAMVLAGYERNRSGRLNQVAADYQTLVADNMPEFSVADWKVLTEALEHTDLSAPQGMRLVWAVLADDARAAHLAERVRTLSVSQLIALRELMWRWWNAQEDSAEAFDAETRLRDLGARVRDDV